MPGCAAMNGSDAGNILLFLNGSVCAADFYGDFCWVAPEAVAVDLYGVAAGIYAGVGEDLQNLGTVAESVRGDGEPAVLEIRGQIDGAVRNTGRRACLDLRW